ncbi:hypothetical protein [Sphingomonas sp.]|uniref:hypothetical protein n=1 Tax=Sphingomonas sp. TaxID=28214 RepID=UPI0025E7AB27|nr:hypothetical protein [Sphingomonas sp.]
MLGILVVLAAHLKSPVGSIVSYTLFAVLTAARFRALEWKVAKAFIPLAIVAGATLLSAVLMPSTVAAAHGVALFAQLFISVRAGLSTGPHDPVSPKLALARDLLAKRRKLLSTLRESKPLHEARQREVAKLVALNTQRQAYVAEHGYEMTEEHKALAARFEAQRNIIAPLAAETDAATERAKAQSEELRQARDAWKNRNQRMVG